MPAPDTMQDARGVNFARKYKLRKFLCKGGFGQVWSCEEVATGEQFACKVFQKESIRTQEQLEALKQEIILLRRLRGKHPAVVQLKDALENDRVVEVVMELCEGGDLYDLIAKHGPLPEASAKHIFRQLASALNYLHCRGVVHRDIKPENVFLDRPAACLYSPHHSFVCPSGCRVQAKLGDFGLSVVLNPGATTVGFTGSRCYTAPEVVEGKAYGRRVDVWSLGVVLCVMLTGKLPFAGKTRDDDRGLRRAIVKANIDFSLPCWQQVSAEAKSLVSKMLQYDPGKRLKGSELLDQPWCREEEVFPHHEESLLQSGSAAPSDMHAQSLETADEETAKEPATSGVKAPVGRRQQSQPIALSPGVVRSGCDVSESERSQTMDASTRFCPEACTAPSASPASSMVESSSDGSSVENVAARSLQWDPSCSLGKSCGEAQVASGGQPPAAIQQEASAALIPAQASGLPTQKTVGTAPHRHRFLEQQLQETHQHIWKMLTWLKPRGIVSQES